MADTSIETCNLPSAPSIWYKASNMLRPVRLELTNNRLLIYLMVVSDPLDFMLYAFIRQSETNRPINIVNILLWWR